MTTKAPEGIEVIKGDSMPHTVMLDGKIVGYIHQMSTKFRYVPKGMKLSKGSELMDSVEKVIESLY